MARNPLTYRAARRNIVLREAKMKSHWPRFRFFSGEIKHPQMETIVGFLESARRFYRLAAR